MLEYNKMEEIKEKLKSFKMSETFFEYSSKLIYTEGVKYLIEELNCEWLLDLVRLFQLDENIKKEELQIYVLKVNSDGSAQLTLEDRDNFEIDHWNTASTDFPLDEVIIWKSKNTIMLPSEQ